MSLVMAAFAVAPNVSDVFGSLAGTRPDTSSRQRSNCRWYSPSKLACPETICGVNVNWIACAAPPPDPATIVANDAGADWYEPLSVNRLLTSVPLANGSRDVAGTGDPTGKLRNRVCL